MASGTWAKRELRRGRLLLLGALVVGAGILAIVFAAFETKPLYARTVTEFAQKPLREIPTRVSGMLVRGSLCKVRDRCEFRFRLTDMPWSAPRSPRELEVRYRSCVVPDTFRDVPGLDLELSVEGELCEGCSTFDATLVLAKCPAKYEIEPRLRQALALPILTCASGSTQ